MLPGLPRLLLPPAHIGVWVVFFGGSQGIRRWSEAPTPTHVCPQHNVRL